MVFGLINNNLTKLTAMNLVSMSGQWSLSEVQAQVEVWNVTMVGIFELSASLVVCSPHLSLAHFRGFF